MKCFKIRNIVSILHLELRKTWKMDKIFLWLVEVY